LAIRKSPPPRRMRSRPENDFPSTEKKGAVSPITQEMVKSSASRRPSASDSPSRRASGCCFRGSLPTRMEMKTTLSMPSTISMAVSVRRLT